MTVSHAGFEVTVDEVKSMSATAWIPTNIFSSFTYEEDRDAESFEISLDALLQCLNIFGNAGGGGAPMGGGGGVKSRRRWAGEGEDSAQDGGANGATSGGGDDWRASRGRDSYKRTFMRMTWCGPGSPLQILLRDDAKGPVTKCDLVTLEPEEQLNQAFDDDRRTVYLIMRSEWFRDALVDLPPSCTRVTLRAQPKPDADTNVTTGTGRAREGSFSLYAEGDFGTVQFDYPSGRDVMDAFECDDEVTFSYSAAHISLLGRALQHSLKICLQIENEGFLSVQIMMPIPDDMPADMHNGILDFKLYALEDDDEA